MIRSITPALPLILCFCPVTTVGQNGALDESFNFTGWQYLSVSQESVWLRAVAVQPDGGIVVSGRTTTDMGTSLLVARLLANGEYDFSFNGSGMVVTDLGEEEGAVGQAIALQGDGKILVTGYSGARMFLARYLANGVPDVSFGQDGIVLAAPGTMQHGDALAVQADGRIVVAGSHSIDGVYIDLGIARYLPDGDLDSTFDADGIRIIDLMSNDEYGLGIAVQADGRILIGGTVETDPDGNDMDFLAVRVNEDGSFDEDFGDAGVVVTYLGPGSDWGRSLSLLPDGRFVIAGWVEAPLLRDIAVVRYQADGSLDPSFGVNGTAIVTSVADEAWATASTLLPNGKLLVAGTTEDNGNESNITVLLFDGAGVLDPTWDADGIVHTDVSGPDEARAIAVQPDGRVVVAGTCTPNANVGVVVRYVNDLNVGTVDASAITSPTYLYPNPLLDVTRFTYSLTTGSRVSLQVLDAKGRIVLTVLADEPRTEGTHEEKMDLAGLVPGNYTLMLSAGDARLSVQVVKQ